MAPTTGSARDVIDYVSWMQHVDYVHSLCDSTLTAIGIFNCFSKSASAERGSAGPIMQAVAG